MFAHLLIEPTPPKSFLTCSNNFIFSRFIYAPTLPVLRSRKKSKGGIYNAYSKSQFTPPNKLDLKRIEKEDSPSL